MENSLEISALCGDVGFDGCLTIERETGADPAGDIKSAKTTLEKLVK